MRDQKVSVDIAKLAREQGFDLEEDCTCGGFPDCICPETRSNPSYIYRPTLSVLQTWMRDVKKINIIIYPFNEVGFVELNSTGKVYYNWSIFELPNLDYNTKDYDTYEEALSEGMLNYLNR